MFIESSQCDQLVEYFSAAADDDYGNGHLAITLLATSRSTKPFVWEIHIAISTLPSMSCAHLRNEKGVLSACCLPDIRQYSRFLQSYD